jgi:(p)ppGpp synthase/HD superfamily hydrolase
MNMAVFFEALDFAIKAHSNQCRKGTQIPYIVHPVSVARILYEYGCSDELTIAGLLHDTVEDTPVSMDEIEKLFGSRVAFLVEAASEPDKSDTWENRKKHTIEYLREAPDDILILACADKLDNIRAIRRDFQVEGEALWERFNRPKESQGWYYNELAKVYGEKNKHSQTPLFSDFITEAHALLAAM